VSGAPDAWLRVRARPGPAADPEALAAALLGAGGRAIEEEPDGVLVTYVPAPGDPEAAEAGLRAALEGVAGEDSLEFELVPARDWRTAWRRGLEPRRVGGRLVVLPAGPDDVVLRIEPGLAFGTGAHGTTRGALRLLEPVAPGAEAVLDIGTGTGILAIAALHLGAGGALGVDPSEDAVEAARRNAREHGVGGRLELERLAVDASVLRLLAPMPFDLVLANIDRPTLEPLLAPMRGLVAGEGAAVVAGILEGEVAGFRDALAGAGWEVEEEVLDEGWWAARLRPGPG